MMPPRLVSCCAAALPRQQDGECSGAAATQPWSHHRSIPRRLLETAVVDRNVGLDLLDRDLLPVLAALATALDRIRQGPARGPPLGARGRVRTPPPPPGQSAFLRPLLGERTARIPSPF